MCPSLVETVIAILTDSSVTENRVLRKISLDLFSNVAHDGCMERFTHYADHDECDDNYDTPVDETAELAEALRLSAEATQEQMQALSDAIRYFVGPVASDPCPF